MNNPTVAMVCVVLLSLVGCGTTTSRGFAIVTNYGNDPQQDPSDSNTYTISVYFNTFASSYDVEENLKRQASDLMRRQGYNSYDVVGRDCQPAAGKCKFRTVFRLFDPTKPIQAYGFSVLPPSGTDWVFAAQSTQGVVFGNRKRSKPGHTFLLGVHTLDLGDVKFDSADDLARVVTAYVSGKESGRFRNVEAQAEPVAVKGVACIRLRLVIEERGNPQFPAGTVLTQTNAGFVCPHPDNPKVAVMGMHSERCPAGSAPILDDALKQEVESVLATVVFTPFR